MKFLLLNLLLLCIASQADGGITLRLQALPQYRDSIILGKSPGIVRWQGDKVVDSLLLPINTACDSLQPAKLFSYDFVWFYFQQNCVPWKLLRVERQRLLLDPQWFRSEEQLQSLSPQEHPTEILWYSAPSNQEALVVYRTRNGQLRFSRITGTTVSNSNPIWDEGLDEQAYWTQFAGGDSIIFVQGNRAAMLHISGDFLGRWNAQKAMDKNIEGIVLGNGLVLRSDSPTTWSLWRLPHE